MRLYQSTQVSKNEVVNNKNGRQCCWMMTSKQVILNQQQEEDDLIKAQKLINPIQASIQHRALHQELLFCYRRGVLPRSKPELQRVLEHRKREQHSKREQALRPPSDLELKLQRRQDRIQALELEEKKWARSQENVPEFVCVRLRLKQISNL